jgi:uncharacterized membrane protein
MVKRNDVKPQYLDFSFSKRDMLPVVCLLAIAVVYRLFFYFESIYVDEFFTLNAASYTIPDMMLKLLKDRVHPPLYYFVTMGFEQILGNNIYRLRLLPMICGLGVVFLSYLLTRALTNDRLIAFIASLAISLSYIQGFFSTQLRQYSFFALFACLYIMAFYFAQRRGTRKDWLLLSLTGFCLVANLYLATFFIAAFAPIVLLSKDKRMIRNWLTTHIPAIMLIGIWVYFLLPYLPEKTREVNEIFSWVDAPSLVGLFTMLAKFTGIPEHPYRYWQVMLLLSPLFLGAVWKLIRGWRMHDERAYLLGSVFCAAILTPLLLLLVSMPPLRMPFFLLRQTLAAQVPFIILLAVGASSFQILKGKGKYALAAMLVLLQVAHFEQGRTARTPFHVLAAHMESPELLDKPFYSLKYETTGACINYHTKQKDALPWPQNSVPDVQEMYIVASPCSERDMVILHSLQQNGWNTELESTYVKGFYGCGAAVYKAFRP